MQKNIFLISIICLLAGFIVAYLIFGATSINNKDETAVIYSGNNLSEDNHSVASPFVATDTDNKDINRLSNLENEISIIKQQLQKMDLTLQDIMSSTGTAPATSRTVSINRNRFSSGYNRQLYNIDNLIRGGIDPGFAEDIVRRKNSIELKRLELQDRATRDNYLNTQRYYDELDGINSQDINLREELGDEQYDEYLYNSKQNNRIKIASVMLGSAGEQAGIKNGDIVLSYNNQRMFTWQELKDATAEGQLGEYVSISIYRNGEVYSFSVPRGPLGVQLGAARLKP
jgi:membrane-associated protease RseP (regulator of RpoE activity)